MTIIGRGALVLRPDRDGVVEGHTLPFVVSDAGIAWHDLDSGPEAGRLPDLVPDLGDAAEIGSGHLALAGLPATPADAFDDITVTVTAAGAVTVRVQHPEPFGAPGGHRFSALDLHLTDPGTGAGLEVAGQVVVAVASGHLTLDAVLDEAGRLRFRIDRDEDVALPARAALTLTTLDVGVDRDDPWAGLVALHTFDEEPDPTADVVFRDSSLVVDADGALDPVDLVGRASRPGPDRPRGVATGSSGGATGGGGLHSPSTAPKLTALRSEDGSEGTNALTVEAWIVNRAKPHPNRKPARIVSLSHSHDKRNFTLGLDMQPSTGHTLYEGRLRSGSGLDGTPGIISVRPQGLGEPAMVVMTRDRSTPRDERAGRIYVDGVDATEPGTRTGDRRGGFGKWEDYRLNVGNEDGADRPWDGELYRIAIYNRELSAEEIDERYRGRVELRGSLTVERLPAPFDQTFPVDIDNGPNGFTTAIDASVGPLTIAPGFTVTDVVFAWPGEAGGPVGGTATANLWGQRFDLDIRVTANRLEFTARDVGQREIDLDTGPGTPHFGHLRLRALTLVGTRAVTDPAWNVAVDGDLRVHALAPPLDQAQPLEVFLHDGQVWAGAGPSADELPLHFFDAVDFDSVDLRYRRTSGRGWVVEADTGRDEVDGVVLGLFGRKLSLTPTMVTVDEETAIELAWERRPGAGSQPVGRAVPELVRFEPNPHWARTSPFWQVDLAATLALGPGSGTGPDIERLDLTIADAGLDRDGGPSARLLTLAGDATIAHGADTLFAGRWGPTTTGGFQIEPSRVELYPGWSTVRVAAEAGIDITGAGAVRSWWPGDATRRPGPSPVDGFVAPGYPLAETSLILDGGRLTLRGHWTGLPEAQAFHASEREGRLYLAGDHQLTLPFAVDLRATADESIVARLGDLGPLESSMTMTVRTELQRTGFLAVVDGVFPVPSPPGDDELVALPSLHLYEAPTTPNAVLGRLVDHLTTNAGALLAEQLAGTDDYHVGIGSDDLRLRFRADAGSGAITTETPPLLEADGAIGAEGQAIRLVQAGDVATLTIDLDADATGAEVRTIADAFLSSVAERSGGPMSAGAVGVLRRRLAERLPLDFAQSLYFHYGWDPERGHIDLHPGMRLRIDPQPYQFVPPADERARSGPTGAGTLHVPIVSHTHHRADGSRADLVGFGAFLSRLERDGQPDLATHGIAGPADITGPAYRRAFYRLFHPSDRSSGSGPERLATIVGFDSLRGLLQGTESYLSAGTVEPSVGSSFFFRGRASVVPEIQVFLDGRPTWVAVGTTLRQLIATVDDVPTAPVSGPEPGQFVRSRPLRLVHEGPSSTPHYRFINLGTDPARLAGTGDGALDALDLPLVKGDRVRS